MNVFEAVKQSVTARQAAENYGTKVYRNSMALCPFHNDRHPSMKLDKRYHCFGCGEDGDVIDFTAKLFGLTAKEAAVKLAEDFGVAYDTRGHGPPVKKPASPKVSERLRQARAEQRAFRAYAGYLHLMKGWKERCAPKPGDTDWHPLFVEALQNEGRVEYLLDILLDGPPEEKKAAVEGREKEVTELEQRIAGHEKHRGRSEKKPGPEPEG